MADEKVELVFAESETKLLKEKYQKLTQVEFDAFIIAAKRYRLNPLANQIYVRLQEQTDRNPRAVTYVTQIDGYRLIADRTGVHAGTDDAVYDSESNAHPGKASVTVYKLVDGQRCPYPATARWGEYCPKNQNARFMWDKMPYLMIAKCAEALALRKAFPNELSGLYTIEEMQQADDPETAPTPANPYRDEQEKRAAKTEKPATATSAAPKSRSSKEIIETKTTASALTTWLIGVQDKMPVADNVDKWRTILDESDDHLQASKWTDAQKKAVVAVLISIKTEIERCELDAGMKAACEQQSDVAPQTAAEDEVPQ